MAQKSRYDIQLRMFYRHCLYITTRDTENLAKNVTFDVNADRRMNHCSPMFSERRREREMERESERERERERERDRAKCVPIETLVISARRSGVNQYSGNSHCVNK